MEEPRKELEKQELPRFEFMKEQIKERPLNKKKLLRRTVMTVSMAVLFGLVACLTVLVLEPVFNNWLYPEEPAENITFPPDTEEILPEDMALDDAELEQETTAEVVAPAPEQLDELELYRKTYGRLQKLTAEVCRSLVTVTGVTSDRDWFDNMYESKGQATGVLIANNGREYLVLTAAEPVQTVETISVTFCDNSQAKAEVKMTDPTTGLAVLAIENKEIGDGTRDVITTAVLGSSNYASLTGCPMQ